MAVRKSQGGNKTPGPAQKTTPLKTVPGLATEGDEKGKQGTPFPRRKKAAQSPKVKQNAEQESPAKSQGTQTPTKRKAEEDPASPAKRIRLEDYIPVEQVVDYGDTQKRTLRLSDFDDSVELEDIEKVCGEGVVNLKQKEYSGRVIYVTYETEEIANAALEKLKSTMIKGRGFTAVSCARDPDLGRIILCVQDIPRSTKRKAMRELFPGCRVRAWLGSSARLEFDNPGDLESAIRHPACHAIRGKKLKFAIDYAHDSKKPASKGKKKGKMPTEKQALTKTPPTTPAKKMVAVSPAGKETPTPGGEKGMKSPKAKTPQKQASVAKTPGPVKSPKTFKPVGAGKSPLPKQSPRTPKQAPRGTPKGVKSTGKKQKA